MVEYGASHPCAARQKPRALYLVVKTKQSWAKMCKVKCTVDEHTCKFSFTSSNRFLISLSFRLCCVLSALIADALVKELQQTARRHRTISFIFIVSGAGTSLPKDAFRKIYWKCRQLCCLPFYTIPEDTGKPLVQSWKA